MKIAFVGDVHGELKEAYSLLDKIERMDGVKIGHAILLGDVHTIRDKKDLNHFPAPQKHRRLGDFPYFLGQDRVPIDTSFIAGNHDNFYWLDKDFPNGGNVLPNLTYLGRAGVTVIGGLHIGFVSGNYSPKQFNLTRGEAKPKHFVREELERVREQNKLARGVDVLVMHDWPSAAQMKTAAVKIRDQNGLEEAVRRGFGNDPLFQLVQAIKPGLVFAGHVHRYLSLGLEIDGTPVRFIGLDKVTGRSPCVSVLDTETLDLSSYKDIKIGLLNSLGLSERAILQKAFNDIEEESATALAVFERLAEQPDGLSKEAVALAHYGIGVVLARLVDGSKLECLPAIDRAIESFEESLVIVDHADAHLMLGQNLARKAALADPSLKEDLVRRARKELDIAGVLNPLYRRDIEKILRAV